MNKGVFSRSMFNRNARNKLYNKGGLPSVQKFQLGGVPKLPPVGMEDYKFLNDMIRSGNVQGLQSILQKRKPGRQGFGSLPFQMTNIARSAERRLNPAPSIMDLLKKIVGPTNKQKQENTKDDSLTSEKLKELKIPEPKPSDVNLSDIPATEEAIKEKYGRGFKPKDIEKQNLLNTGEDPAQTDFDAPKLPTDLTEDPAQTDFDAKLVETPKAKPKNTSLIDTKTLNNDLNAVSTEIKTKLEGTENLNYDPQGLGNEEFGLTNQEIVDDGVELSQQVKELTKAYNPESKNPEEVLSFNDKLLEITGAKDKDKPIQSLKERAKINKELYKDFFGEDPEDEKRTAALNMAFAGFAAAAGESPHALQNFARAGMEFTKRTADSAEKRKARKEKINMFALTNALQDERSEKSWSREMDKWEKGIKYDWLKTVKGSDDQKNMVAARLLANKENVRAQILASSNQLADKLALQEKLTKFQVESKESIATLNAELTKRKLNQNIEALSFQEKKLLLTNAVTKDIAASRNRASMLNTLLSNFDDASTLAFFQMQEELGPDADINKIFGGDFLTKVAKIAETLPKEEQDTKLPYSLSGYIQTKLAALNPTDKKFLLQELSKADSKYAGFGSDEEKIRQYFTDEFNISQPSTT
jgi:hypothetical protein